MKSAEGQTFTMTIDSEIEVTRDKKKCRKGSSRQIYTSSSMPGAIRSPRRAIQELAGHRELGMTQRYMHLSPAALDAAIQLLDGRGHSGARGSIVATSGADVGEARNA